MEVYKHQIPLSYLFCNSTIRQLNVIIPVKKDRFCFRTKDFSNLPFTTNLLSVKTAPNTRRKAFIRIVLKYFRLVSKAFFILQGCSNRIGIFIFKGVYLKIKIHINKLFCIFATITYKKLHEASIVQHFCR